MDRTEVAEKIRKLLRLAQDAGTVGEAAAAAARAQALADKHALDLAEIGEVDDPSFSDHADEPLDVMRTTQAWRIALASALANYNGCEILTELRQTPQWEARARRAAQRKKRRPPRPRAVLVVGPTDDARTVRYLYAYLSRTIAELADRACAGKSTASRRSYCLGAVATIGARLQQERQAVYANARRAARGDKALMRIDRAIALRDQQVEAVREWIERENEIVHEEYSEASDPRAYHDGARAGLRIALASDGPAIEEGEGSLPEG